MLSLSMFSGSAYFLTHDYHGHFVIVQNHVIVDTCQFSIKFLLLLHHLSMCFGLYLVFHISFFYKRNLNSCHNTVSVFKPTSLDQRMNPFVHFKINNDTQYLALQQLPKYFECLRNAWSRRSIRP